MVDDSPDISYLGEYGNRPESDYAIDRAHSEDCIENDSLQKEKLERIADYIESLQSECDCADRSWYGETHDTACPLWLEASLQESCDAIRELAECDCSSSGHWDSREYRYFNPNHQNYKGLPEAEIRKYCRQDFDRMESLNAGNWCYIGIRAEAEIAIPCLANKGCVRGHEVFYSHTQTITSGGLYGIESDSGREHLEETGREELHNLKTELLALGFSKRAIASAFKNVQEKEG